ncbi:hypothetical protein [Nocardia sp. NPDC019395]|uniref:hypothetical protein n=1 Tax=Nocardia sp. NPDC019395 TaxID=3154686 RepID=UPI0033F5D0C9
MEAQVDALIIVAVVLVAAGLLASVLLWLRKPGSPESEYVTVAELQARLEHEQDIPEESREPGDRPAEAAGPSQDVAATDEPESATESATATEPAAATEPEATAQPTSAEPETVTEPAITSETEPTETPETSEKPASDDSGTPDSDPATEAGHPLPTDKPGAGGKAPAERSDGHAGESPDATAAPDTAPGPRPESER